MGRKCGHGDPAATHQPAPWTHPICAEFAQMSALPCKRSEAPEGAPLIPLDPMTQTAYRRLAMAWAKPMVLPVPPRSPVSESLASIVATMALRRRSAFSGWPIWSSI